MRNIIVYNLKDWKKMLKEGQTVYFIVQGIVMSGTVINVKEMRNLILLKLKDLVTVVDLIKFHLNKFIILFS